MTKKKVLTIIGTRPEAIKMAPIVMELKRRSDFFVPLVCATAQHREMLGQALGLFDIEPDHDLDIMAPGQTLSEVTSSRIVMVGNGENRKSIAYVENVAAFLLHSLTLPAGIHVCNYVDKPDFTMNSLIAHVCLLLGITDGASIRLSYTMGLLAAKVFDFASLLTGKRFAISSIRGKKSVQTRFTKHLRKSWGLSRPSVCPMPWLGQSGTNSLRTIGIKRWFFTE